MINFTKFHKAIFILMFVSLLFQGCSDKEVYNKPAIEWYKNVVAAIQKGALDEADDNLMSLRGEHYNSPLVPLAIMNMATAYMNDGKYKLAIYELDEYIKKVNHKEDIEYAKYLRIRAKVSSLILVNRDQSLLNDTIIDTEKFLKENKNSIFYLEVSNIDVILRISRDYFNGSISNLYAKLDHNKASKLYKNKIDKLQDAIKTSEPKDAWYRRVFYW